MILLARYGPKETPHKTLRERSKESTDKTLEELWKESERNIAEDSEGDGLMSEGDIMFPPED